MSLASNAAKYTDRRRAKKEAVSKVFMIKKSKIIFGLCALCAYFVLSVFRF